MKKIITATGLMAMLILAACTSDEVGSVNDRTRNNTGGTAATGASEQGGSVTEEVPTNTSTNTDLDNIDETGTGGSQ